MQRDIENIIFENTPKIQELAHICETNTATVSYTHLDVYKRQGCNHDPGK